MNQPLENRDDIELIQQTLNGRTEAFGDLIHRYQNRLYNGMVHLVRNEIEAEDVVQEAFVLAMTKLASFKGHSQFYTWLYRIAYNTAVTRIRRRKPTVSLDHQKLSPRFDLEDEDSILLLPVALKDAEESKILRFTRRLFFVSLFPAILFGLRFILSEWAERRDVDILNELNDVL